MNTTTNKPSKSETRNAIAELLENGNRSSKLEGDMLASLISRLQFWGARVNEPRGLSDTGLDLDTLCKCVDFAMPDYQRDAIWEYIGAAIDEDLGR